MPLSDKEIRLALEMGAIRIAPFDPDSIQPSSYDLTIGPEIRFITGDEPLDPAADIKPRYEAYDLSQGAYIIPPGGFVLGACRERIAFGPYCGFVITRSSYARMGLLFNLSAYANPGYEGTLPLAIANLSGKPVRLTANLRVAQVLFLEVGEVERPYGASPDRKYIGETGVTPPKQHLDREIRDALRAIGVPSKQVERAKNLIDSETESAADAIVQRLIARADQE
jgi:dCTP deaminase